MTGDDDGLPPRRVIAILQDVADGHVELVCGCEPDLVVDGRYCCDQFMAHLIVRAGWVQPLVSGIVGQRVKAGISRSGRKLLESVGNNHAG